MTTVAVFYGSLVALTGIFVFSAVEHRSQCRIVFPQLRGSLDRAAVFFVGFSVRLIRIALHAIVIFFARSTRSVSAGIILRMRRLSARLRDIAERRRSPHTIDGPVSHFLKTVMEHKIHIREGEVRR